MAKRISKDVYYMNIAKAVAERSTCLKRHYGCVIVKNDEIIATGYNGSARGEANCCDMHDACPRLGKPNTHGDYSDCPAVHAEQNAMISAPRRDMIGATIYLIRKDVTTPDGDYMPTAKPCLICERMLKNAGITRIVGPQDIIQEEE